MAKEILIIEDEGIIASLLSRNLRQKGYNITTLGREEAPEQARKHTANLILLEGSGKETFEMCQFLRDATTAPIIVLTDSTSEFTEIAGVECLVKPLDFQELLTTIESALNYQWKRKKRTPHILRRGDLILDLQTKCLTKGERRYHLTPKEFLLLKMFMSSPGQVLSYKMIMKEIWNTDYLGDTRTLYVHVNWIRKKIEDAPGKPEYLRTVRGLGYRFEIKP